jgi:hypothetical protein
LGKSRGGSDLERLRAVVCRRESLVVHCEAFSTGIARQEIPEASERESGPELANGIKIRRFKQRPFLWISVLNLKKKVLFISKLIDQHLEKIIIPLRSWAQSRSDHQPAEEHQMRR